MDQRHIDMVNGMRYEFEVIDRICRNITADNAIDAAREVYSKSKSIQEDFLDELVRYLFEISSEYIDTISNVVDICIAMYEQTGEFIKNENPSEEDIEEYCKVMISNTERARKELALIRA